MSSESLQVTTSYKDANDLVDFASKNYFNDPINFAIDLLRVKEIHEKPQKEFLREIVKNDALMRTGHGVGKSFTLAMSLIWFFFTRPFCRIPILGPSWKQLKNFLWSEIDKLWFRLPPEFRAIAHKTETQTFYMREFRTQWAAFTFSTKTDPNLLEGLHAGYVYIVLEEAKSIRDEAFNAIDGAVTTKHYKKGMGSTPGDPVGEFYNANTRNSHLWSICHAAQWDSPLVDPQTIQDKAEKWGKGSPLFITKCGGNFAPGGVNRVFTLDALEQAMGRYIEIEGDKILGVDVARFGDDMTAFVLYQGGQVLDYHQYGGKDLMYTAGMIKKYYEDEEIKVVCIDDRGLGGGVTDRIRETLPPRVEIIPIDGSQKPIDDKHYHSWQIEILFVMSEKAKKGELRLGNYDELRAQLSTVPYKFTSDAAFQMVPDFHLPDGAAALSHAVWAEVVGKKSTLSSFMDVNESGSNLNDWERHDI